jgi:hypothetical protein
MDKALENLVGGRRCLAAAIDGPLGRDLPVFRRCRSAEQVLTRAFWSTIGKPGQASSPNGIKLNEAANRAARTLECLGCVDTARHRCAILETAVVEAFPTAFLGVMLKPCEVSASGRRSRSDTYYKRLTESEPCRLAGLLQHLLPDHRMHNPLSKVRNHDERAAVACAATALAITVGCYTAVGHEDDGWIVLPPRLDDGMANGLQPWADVELRRHT